MALAGMDPMQFLKSGDQDEILAMQAVARGVARAMLQRDKNLAVLIANNVWGALK